MPIHILTVGSLKEKYFRDAAAEYLKRLTRYDKVSVSEIPDIAEPANASAAQIAQTVASEGERILSLIKGEDYVTALCIQAPRYSSEQFAQKLLEIKNTSRRHVFVIGGSNGLSDKVLARANEQLSFSDMTFPHQLARVMLLEQIYRACKINANERYHK